VPPPKGDVRAKTKSNLDFRLMSLTYKFRDFLLPPMSILKEVGIESGFHVLDFGCGPGSYDPNGVLAELHIVLRPKGILSVTDHHMKQDEIVSRVTSRGLLKLSAKGKRTYSFSREE
jgi:cyclopropane fatty-acyl-phospholipid synthase-like methyltransferase